MLSELVPELSLTYVGFRRDPPPFSNTLVRKAFSHAIDREAVKPERCRPRHGSDDGRRDPARDARPLPPGRPRVRSRAGAAAPRRGRIPESGRGLPQLTLVVSERAEFADALGGALGGGARRRGRGAAGEGPPVGLASSATPSSGWPAGRPTTPIPTGSSAASSARAAGRSTTTRRSRTSSNARAALDELERAHAALPRARPPLGLRARGDPPVFYGRSMLVRRPWIEDLWTTPLTRTPARPGRRRRRTRPGAQPEYSAAAPRRAAAPRA